MGWVASPHHPVPAGRGVSAEPAAGLGGKRCPRSRAPRCAGWCGRCCPGSGSGRVSCCDGLRTSSGATNDRGALMRSGVPPDAGKAQESLLEAVVVILVPRSEKFMRKFVATTPQFKERRLSLAEIYESLDEISETAQRYLRSVVWHRLGVVQTRIPHLAQTSDAVNRQLSCFSSRYMNLIAVFQI